MTNTRYELYWKNGESENPRYQKVGNTYRSIKGVIRRIRFGCNHSHGSGFKVYEIINGKKVEINYHAFLK